MDLLKEITEQTAIRRQLLANGYVPLANKDKMCVLPGWPGLPVDEAQIDVWSRQLKWRATGVRVEGGLAVIDLDINDAAAIDAIVDAIPAEIWTRLQDAPVRLGKGAKQAWFVRLAEGEEPFYRVASGGWRASEDDETVQRAEIFACPNGGRQFGAYGAHTIGDDREVAVQYRWLDGRGLCEVPFDQLPALTRAEMVEVASIASQVLGARGWINDLKSKEGFSSGAPIYDLTDDMVFETREHGEVSLSELEELAEMHDSVRLSASWLEGPSANNTTRCIAYINQADGRLSILETAAYERHRPKDLLPLPVTSDALDRLRAVAEGGAMFKSEAHRPAPRAESAEGEPTPPSEGEALADGVDVVVRMLLQQYALCPSEHRAVVPIHGLQRDSMTVAALRTMMLPFAIEVKGKRGGVKVINPADVWAAHPDRITVSGYRFKPDRAAERIMYEPDGSVFINSYRPLAEVPFTEAEAVGARDAFEALLAHLVPAADERDWLRMWLASKVQRPELLNCGVLLIAERQGTGRGTLFDMMRAAVGREYYRTITSVELMGGSGQGAYTEWAERALLVVVEEVMAGNDGGGSMSWKRKEAYERIKQLIDPRARVMPIRKKGVRNEDDVEVFFSLLMATNHADALPLEVGDRRVAVFMQPDVVFDDVDELKALVNPWRAAGPFSAAFGAALRAHLRTVAVDEAALRIAPDLGPGREIMRESNETDLDDILRCTLDKIPGGFILNRDLKRRLQNAIMSEGEGDHLKNWWVRAQDTLKRPNRIGWRAMQTRQNYACGDTLGKGVIYWREASGRDLLARWLDASWEERGEMLAAASDVNRMATAMEAALRDGRLSVVKGD